MKRLIKCQICGTPFIAYDKNRKTCSKQCRNIWMSKHLREKFDKKLERRLEKISKLWDS